MPGRDELIQQNIDRARASSQAPQPQEDQSKSSSGMSAPKSFLGGNYDVYSALQKVEFVENADASMRGNIAYIRLWSRDGSAQQTSAASTAQQPGPSTDPQQQLEQDLYDATTGYIPEDDIFGGGGSDTNIFGVPLSPEAQELRVIPLWEGPSDPSSSTGPTTQTSVQPNTDRQVALSAGVPTSDTEASDSTNTTNPPSPPEGGPGTTPPPPGGVKSANPSGISVTSVAKSFVRAVLGYPPDRSTANAPASNESVGTSSFSAVSGEKMWQFLFNPSELELEAGPEFKNSETWGVSDKANSGQPLHWSHNKNALLKFNSVLLNGFVFGRKVEALEQGLIELFMAREGEGQHGPHILEFVWGKRVFGPCVIKNINIKEKMWDEGEVVNAEVSFTLEQVPEWTINDGFVDVARPGKLATIGDPTTQGSSASSPPATTPPATTPPPTTPSSPDQKPAPAPTDPNARLNLSKKCLNLKNTISNLESIRSSPNFFGIPKENSQQAQQRLAKYKNYYNFAVLNAITPVNVGNYTPAAIESRINAQWRKNSVGQTGSGLLQTRYPFQYANSEVAKGVGYLIGNLETQSRSSACTNPSSSGPTTPSRNTGVNG